MQSKIKKIKKIYSDINSDKKIRMNIKRILSDNAVKDIVFAIIEDKEHATINPSELIKLKNNTIKKLVDYGVQDLPMMVRKGHLRENILTEKDAQKLGYSTKNKHFHGLGVKKYIEIICSLDNPKKVYQYTGKGKYNSKNFIILSMVKINNKNAIVPVEIENRGTYNKVDILYNRIKTVYAKDDSNYINILIDNSELIEIK